jgi:hypothetical protein
MLSVEPEISMINFVNPVVAGVYVRAPGLEI